MDLNKLWDELERKETMDRNSPLNKQSWDNPILSKAAFEHCQQQIDKLRTMIKNPPMTQGFLIEYGDPTKPAGIMTRLRIRLLFNHGQFTWSLKEVTGLGIEGSGLYYNMAQADELIEWARKTLMNYHRTHAHPQLNRDNFSDTQFFFITEHDLKDIPETRKNMLLGIVPGDGNQLEIV